MPISCPCLHYSIQTRIYTVSMAGGGGGGLAQCADQHKMYAFATHWRVNTRL